MKKSRKSHNNETNKQNQNISEDSRDHVIEKIPQNVIDILKSKALISAKEDIRVYVSCDLDEMGNYADYHLCVIDKKLIKLMLRGGNEFISTYELCDIERIEDEYMVSSGSLYIIKGENKSLLCRFTTEKNQMMAVFVNLCVKAMEHELTQQDLDDSQIDDICEQYCPKCGERYVDAARKLCPKCMNKMAIVRRVFKYVSPYKMHMAAIIILMLISAVMSAVVPYLTGTILYDQVIEKEGKFFGMVTAFIFVLAVMKILELVFRIFYQRISAKLGALVSLDIKKDIFDAIQSFSMSFFTSHQTGSLMTHINSDVTFIQHFIVEAFPNMVANVLQIIGIFSLLMSQNVLLTLLILIPFPIGIFLLRWFWNRIDGKYDKQWSKRSSLNSMISDVFAGLRVVKAFAGEKSEKSKFSKASDNLKNASLDVQDDDNTFFPIFNFILGISVFLIWAVGGLMVINADVLPKSLALTLGGLMTYTASTPLIYGPIQYFIEFAVWKWSEFITNASRAFDLMDIKPDILEKENPVPLDNFRGEIEFNNVNFAYEANRPILKDVSFSLESGKTLGIVGRTGSGKSTIVNLLIRLYDAGSGKIMIDGHDVRDVKISDLRRNVAMVSQEVYIFKGTIADNIRYANLDASIDEVIMAAKIANAHDFIMQMPDGYEEYIGESGRNLSGGERQRISIARAILKNAKLLILDEATAAMDTQTERDIQNALTRLIKGKTTIMIAHRLSTLRDADSLIVIDDGGVAESGTHSELINAKGKYYELYKIQSEAFKHIGVA